MVIRIGENYEKNHKSGLCDIYRRIFDGNHVHPAFRDLCYTQTLRGCFIVLDKVLRAFYNCALGVAVLYNYKVDNRRKGEVKKCRNKEKKMIKRVKPRK